METTLDRPVSARSPVVTVSQCFDADYLERLILDNWAWISNDSTPRLDSYAPLLGSGLVFALQVDVDGVRSGLFLLIAQGPGIADIHTLLERRAWGRTALAAGRAARDWLLANTTLSTLVTTVYSNNKHTARYATALGFNLIGIDPAGTCVAGQPVDILHYELNLNRN